MIRVLIADQSAVARKTLSGELEKHLGIKIVGALASSMATYEKAEALLPDVIVLDASMPRLDGEPLCRLLTSKLQLAVVALKTQESTSHVEVDDLVAHGALEILARPGMQDWTRFAGELARSISRAATSRLVARRASPTRTALPAQLTPVTGQPWRRPLESLLVIGASTGGTNAIEAVLQDLPESSPPTIIVQHMPEGFTARYAERLDRSCHLEVREARDGDVVESGRVLLAPGDFHLLVEKKNAVLVVRTTKSPQVHHQRPSVDVLFESVARLANKLTVAVLLTGMGSDGAKGLLALKTSGALTIAQDEESCVVYGMPREAVRLGAATKVVPLPLIARTILQAFASQQTTAEKP